MAIQAVSGGAAVNGMDSAGMVQPVEEPTRTPGLSADTLVLSQPARPSSFKSVLDAVPAATSVEESERLLPERQAAVVTAEATAHLEDPTTHWYQAESLVTKDHSESKMDFALHADARLSEGKDIQAVNDGLMKATAYADPGTHFLIVPGIGRHGDYDFSLQAMTRLAFDQWSNPQLKPEARQHLATEVMNQEGTDHLPDHWLLGLIPETENHILMTETSRYLKNQLVATYGTQFSTHHLAPEQYDNAKNGFNDWMVNHLSQFVRRDFGEYNSKPYQNYSHDAIQNLYDFSSDPRVKKSAQILLDYMNARFALQSSDLRRSVPFRRRPEFAKGDNVLENDGEAIRNMVLAGNYQSLQQATAETKAPDFALKDGMTTSYRIPEPVLDLMIDKAKNPYFALVHHGNTEIVDSEAGFLISAGGHYQKGPYNLPFSTEENAVVMPTTVMLTGGGPLLSQTIRFLGRGDNDRLNNTGVYENFAFGIRPALPDGLEDRLRQEGKLTQNGEWTYMDLGTSYVALFRRSQASPDNYAPAIGALEIVNHNEFASLADFQAKVETNNAGRTFSSYGSNRYTTTRGKTIEFVMADPLENGKPPKPDVINTWAVRRVWDGDQELPIETNFDRWPLIASTTLPASAPDHPEGDFVMKADGTGQVIINDPARKQSLLLSLADQQNPIRIEQNGEAVNLTETAGVEQKQSDGLLQVTVQLPQTEKVRYVSMPWESGAEPVRVRVYVQRETDGLWKVIGDRQMPDVAYDHAFRTDFDLDGIPQGRAIRIVAVGPNLKPAGKPDVYRGY